MDQTTALAQLGSFLAFARQENEMFGGVKAQEAWDAFVVVQQQFDPKAGELLYQKLIHDDF